MSRKSFKTRRRFRNVAEVLDNKTRATVCGGGDGEEGDEADETAYQTNALLALKARRKTRNRNKKTRRRLKSEELFLLETAFERNPNPDQLTRVRLAESLAMSVQQVTTWCVPSYSRSCLVALQTRKAAPLVAVTLHVPSD